MCLECKGSGFEMLILSLSCKDPMEKEMTTHSSILTREIPWMDEHGRLQSMGSQSRTRLSDGNELN